MAGEAVSAPAPQWKPRKSFGLMPVLLVFGATVMVMGALVVSPGLAPAVPVGIAAAYAIWKLPLRISVLGLIATELLLEGLAAPLGGQWQVPVLYTVSSLMFSNLNSITGIGFLRLPMIDLLCIVFWVSSSMHRTDPKMTSQTASVRVLNSALLVQLVALIGLDVLGAAQGGNVNESLWQMRQLLLFGVRTVMCLRAFDATVAQLKLIGQVLMVVGIIKSLIGIYFIHIVVPGMGLQGVEFSTSHSDTLMFVGLLMMVFNLLMERFTWAKFWKFAPWVAIVFMGMIANDRRLAWVCLGGSVIATFLMAERTRLKRGLLRLGLLMMPIMPLYVGIGWNSDSAIFGPAQLIKGMAGGTNTDTSTDYRDIENFNVLTTWSQHAFFPMGFGHKFVNMVPLPDISTAMPTWQYHPHNQYLWLQTIGSPFGFLLLMLPWIIGMLLCGRAYRAATHPVDRAAVMTCVAIYICCLNQLWGDMGTLSHTVSFFSAFATALVSKIAIRVGGWPATAPSKKLEATT